MSGSPSRRVSAGASRTNGSADPWWFDENAEAPLQDVVIPGSPDRSRRRSRGRRRSTSRNPLTRILRHIVSTPRFRRFAVRLLIITSVVALLGGSVGVILLNNVVMKRTAELGKLDNQRRELRRDNAMLDAEAARRSASPRVIRRAEEELGMVRAPQMPAYIWLDPSSRGLTTWQRNQRAKMLAERKEKRAAAAAAKADKTAETKSGNAATAKAGAE